jgi:hypothetical protein
MTYGVLTCGTASSPRASRIVERMARARTEHRQWPFSGRALASVLSATTALLGSAVLGNQLATPLADAAHLTTATWRATELPIPPLVGSDGAEFAGPIACGAVGNCVALGEYTTPSGVPEDSIITGASGAWSVTRALLPFGGRQAANFGPFGLACSGVGDCVGTSVYVTRGSLAADILEEVNGTWSTIAMPVPSNLSPSGWPAISSVACPAAGDCVIVGDYPTTAGTTEGLIVTEEAGRFVPAEAPIPGGANDGAGLAGVACFEATACVAVGDYEPPSGDREGLLVGDRAGVMGSIAAPLPSNAGPDPEADLQAISCGSSTGCAALGQYETSTGDHLGVIDTSSDGHWSGAEMPSASGANATSPFPVVYGVACRGATSCLGVGRYHDSSSASQGLALVEHGGRWSASMIPATDGRSPVVGAVSCASATSCGAAGSYDVGGRLLGYVMSMNGTSLSGGAAPSPGNAGSDPSEVLGSISCPGTGVCDATGTYAETGQTTVRLPVVVSP